MYADKIVLAFLALRQQVFCNCKNTMLHTLLLHCKKGSLIGDISFDKNMY